MKTAKRVFICSLCVSLLLSCSIFSVGVSAEDTSSYDAYFDTFDSTLDYSYNAGSTGEQVYAGTYTNKSITYSSSSAHLTMSLYISKTNGELIAKKGDKVTFSIPCINAFFSYENATGTISKTVPMEKFDILNIVFMYTDGTNLWSDSIELAYSSSSKNHYLSGSFTALKDISKFRVYYSYNPYTRLGLTGTYITNTEWVIDSFSAEFDIQSEEAGLLGDINNSVQQGTNQITGEIQDQTNQQKGFFQQLGDRISGFFDKLLTGIIDGLKNLFVPGDVTDPETGQQISYFTHYFNEWDEWMQDHFGVLYFPFAILFDVLDQILSFRPPANPTITFPGLEIMGQTLLKPINYDFSTFDMPWLNTAHDLYLFAVDAIIGFWLVRLAYKKLTEIMGGGS